MQEEVTGNKMTAAGNNGRDTDRGRDFGFEVGESAGSKTTPATGEAGGGAKLWQRELEKATVHVGKSGSKVEKVLAAGRWCQ